MAPEGEQSAFAATEAKPPPEISPEIMVSPELERSLAAGSGTPVKGASAGIEGTPRTCPATISDETPASA